MTRATVTRTPRDHARDLARANLPALRAPAGATAVGVYIAARAMVPGLARCDLDAALDYLAERGLCDELVLDGLVSEATPQRYRWTRTATPDALVRFADRPDRPEPIERGPMDCLGGPCEVCGEPARRKYCSLTCNRRAYAARQRAKGAA